MSGNEVLFPSRLEDLRAYIFGFGGKAKPGPSAADSPNQCVNADLLSPSRPLRINRVYFWSLAISLAFLAFGVLFILYSSWLSREDTLGYVQLATHEVKFAVEDHISDELTTLGAAAMVAEDRDLLAVDGALNSLLKGLRAYNSYVSIGFADTSKRAVWVDSRGRKHHADRLDEDFIDQALANKEAVSGTRWDESNRMFVNFYAVPVHDNGSNRVKGVLFAADPEDEIRTVIEHALHGGQGLAHIIDSNGEFVVKSQSPLVLSIGKDIFSLSPPMKEDMRQQTAADLKAGKEGYLERAVYGENRLASFTPLAINDWFIFYAVPENRVSAGLKNLTVGAVAVIVVAMLLFASLILLIRQVNNRARRTLEAIAFVDPVTGGRNYNKFLLDAAAILRNAGRTNYALFYADIEGFRYINDLLGRGAGDRLLCYWANFLQELSREGEAFGRVSGDIFVALRKYNCKQEVETRFMSLMHRLAVYPETLSRGYKVEVYGGVYLTGEADERLSLNDMLDRAITAQKAAKAAGGGGHLGFYSHEMREQKLWETEVESTMEASLEKGEFQMYLQPKIDIQHGNRIMGAEALVRWISPEKGIIPPGRFIELFERNGFVVKLDRSIFESTCQYYRKSVLEEGLPPYILSVNVSKLSLMQPDFCRIYTDIKEQYGIPDGCLELEFTESLVFENHALLQSIVTDCKRHGFLCSLDDFGAGYSSLNLLKSIYVDVLKLDRLFFQYGDNPERGRELVRNIVTMAKALGMKIVAEGIDMPEQVEQLRDMGCDAIQGYVFAKPMPTREFECFFETWNNARSEGRLHNALHRDESTPNIWHG